MKEVSVLTAAPVALIATALGPTWLWIIAAPLAVFALAIAVRQLHTSFARFDTGDDA